MLRDLQLALLLPLWLAAQPAALDTAAIGRSVREELASTRTPGAVIGVVKGDRLIFSKAYGLSNVETSTPVTTVIASLSHS